MKEVTAGRQQLSSQEPFHRPPPYPTDDTHPTTRAKVVEGVMRGFPEEKKRLFSETLSHEIVPFPSMPSPKFKSAVPSPWGLASQGGTRSVNSQALFLQNEHFSMSPQLA